MTTTDATAGPDASATTDNTGATTPDKLSRPPWKRALRLVAQYAAICVVALVVVGLVLNFLVQPYLVPSDSMENTLKENDTILVWKPGELERGSIVVFKDDLGWLPPAAPASGVVKALAWLKLRPNPDDQFLVKRLIGLPYDHVSCCDAEGRVVVNGMPLDESSYLYYSNVARSQIAFDLVVPAGHIFVLGDHRDDSEDSRYHMCQGHTPTPELAFPSVDSVQGKVLAVVGPLSRFRTFSTPETFATATRPIVSLPSANPPPWTC